MLLRFGPVRLRLHGSSRWCDLARQRYDGFVDEPPGAQAEDLRIDYDVEYEDNGEGPAPRDPERNPLGPMEMSRRSEVWHLEARCSSGTLSGRHLRLRGPLATYPLDSALIALWSLAFRGEAAIVHGALLAEGERGWLCTGPSGVGKSTLAGLLPEHALCDELVGVRIEATTSGPGLFAYGLPFWRGRPDRARLAGVHRLRHGVAHDRRRLTADEAFARLRSQILWPSWSEDALAGAFRVAAALADLPCHDLAFRPEPDVWDHVKDIAVEVAAAPQREMHPT